MKILIIGDSHDNIANIKHLMGFAKKIEAKAIVHTGDWSGKEAVGVVLDAGIPLYTVLGNADVGQGLEEFIKFNAKKFDPDFLKASLGGRKIGIIHKVKKDDKRFESLDIVFSGHYHSKEERVVDFTKFIRPGALIRGINFAIYETVSNKVEFINEKI